MTRLKPRFSIRDLLWLTVVVALTLGIAGCGGETPDEKARRKSAENMDRTGKALLEYEKTHPAQFDENGKPLKSKSP